MKEAQGKLPENWDLRLPFLSGECRVSGLRDGVRIRRDTYGIPYITSETEEDAWFALGFCQGQDRAFQIEYNFRIARGSLSELLGPEALPIDRLLRRIGLWKAAEKQWKVMDKDIRRMVQAYLSGINQGVRSGGGRLAHEFELMGAEPSLWSVVDVLGYLKLLSFLFASNWSLELSRLKVLSQDGLESLRALDPIYAAWHPVITPTGSPAKEAIDRLLEDLSILEAATGTRGGSNCFTLGPSRTATGKPIMGNDPHVGPSLPNIFYLAHMKTRNWKAAGATFAGLPCFACGFNGTAAWGLTSANADDTDLFLQEIGPDGRSFRVGDRFLPGRIRQEVIQVKGESNPVVEEVLETHLGPIITPALQGELGALSILGTWLDAEPVTGLFRIHRVRSFEDFKEAFRQWTGPCLNMHFADTSGAIGYQLAGKLPLRRRGYGTIPMPGWDPAVGWEGRVPYDDLPWQLNPEKGFVVSANNKPLVDGKNPFLGADWAEGYRAARIVEALKKRKDWDLKGIRRLQSDVKSLAWFDMRHIILSVPARTRQAQNSLELLESWNGRMAADSPAAALFELFTAEMIKRAVRAKAPKAAEWALGKGFTPLAPRSLLSVRRMSWLVRLLRKQPPGWFRRGWPAEMADALNSVTRMLRQRFGNGSEEWPWGKIRPLTLTHPLGRKHALPEAFNRGPVPCSGDSNTINNTGVNHADPLGNPTIIAALRMAVDVGNWGNNSFSLAGGQSGNPISPHYDDLLSLWKHGKGISIHWSPQEVNQAAAYELRLTTKHGSQRRSRNG